jgi:hypothetical protein
MASPSAFPLSASCRRGTAQAERRKGARRAGRSSTRGATCGAMRPVREYSRQQGSRTTAISLEAARPQAPPAGAGTDGSLVDERGQRPRCERVGQDARMSVSPPANGPGELGTSSAGSRADGGETPEPSEGLSEFLRKVLDQLSLSAWLPAVMFVGCTALLLQLAASASTNLSMAILQLAEKPLGIIVVLLFGLILSAMVIQAFSFEVIRLLEGYWGGSRIGALISSPLIWYQAQKLRRLRRRHLKQQLAAFNEARKQMLSRGISRTTIDILEDDVLGRSGSQDQSDKDEARILGWRRFSTPQKLAKLDRLIAHLSDFPDDHRVLPTKLGNVLRSAEDRLDLPDGDLEGLVMRRYDQIPARIKAHHDQFRTRLDMYCILFFVFAILSALSSIVVVRAQGDPLSYIYPAAFAVLAAVSYSASITSARGYGAALRAIQRGST